MFSFIFPLFSLILSLTVSSAAAGEVTDRALGRMQTYARTYGPRSYFVFDLDETTVDSTPRRFASLQQAIAGICQTSLPDCPALERIKLGNLYRMENRYDIAGFLRQSGARDETVIAQVNDGAFKIYLSGAYIVEKDRLVPGAGEFIRSLKASGARVYFVTSRSIERQLQPTLKFLVASGLIRPGEENSVLLKADAEPSVDFKQRITAEIEKHVLHLGGRVDGIFENEPENLAVWILNFPGAQPFFVDGSFVKEGPVSPRAIHLRDFRFTLGH